MKAQPREIIVTPWLTLKALESISHGCTVKTLKDAYSGQDS